MYKPFSEIPIDHYSIAQSELNIDNKTRSNLFTWNGQFSPQFIESVQDLGMFDMSLTSEETDCLYRSFYDQVKGLRIEVEDNQLLIITIDDPAMMDAYSDRIKEETQEEIESALEKVGLSPSDYLKELRVAVA